MKYVDEVFKEMADKICDYFSIHDDDTETFYAIYDLLKESEGKLNDLLKEHEKEITK